MKERPILFSTEMVKAILEGRKTQTRRVVKFKNQNEHRFFNAAYPCASNKTWIFWSEDQNGLADFTKQAYNDDGIKCPYGKPGDRLWIRETFYAYGEWDLQWDEEEQKMKWRFIDLTILNGLEYKYEDNPPEIINKKRVIGIKRWWKRPSIFMPREAARIFLEITNIRVERVQDITRSDIRSEGLTCPKELCSDDIEYNYKKWYLDEWIKLWDFINAKRGFGWDVNPWVWVVEFKKN